MKHHAHRCDIYKIARQCGVVSNINVHRLERGRA